MARMRYFASANIKRISRIVLSLGLASMLGIGCGSKEISTAKVYRQQHDWEKAITQLENAIAEHPKNAEAYYLLGESCAHLGRFEEMSRAFATCLKLSTKFEIDINRLQQKYFSEHFNAGLSAANANDFSTAKTHFLIAQQIQPMQPETYKSLAQVYAKLGQDEEAMQQYRALLEIAPDDVDAFLGIANLHQQRREYDKSAATLTRALAQHPNHPALLAELAAIYECLGERQKAITYYQQALQLQPEDRALLLDLGRLYADDGNYSEAVKQFANVLIFYPEDFEATYHAGMCHLKIGEQLSKEAYDLEAQFSEPANPSVAAEGNEKPLSDSLRAVTLRAKAQESFKAAMPYLQKAVELDPGHAGAWFNLGVGQAWLGRTEAAKEAFRQSEALQVSN